MSLKLNKLILIFILNINVHIYCTLGNFDKEQRYVTYPTSQNTQERSLGQA